MQLVCTCKNYKRQKQFLLAKGSALLETLVDRSDQPEGLSFFNDTHFTVNFICLFLKHNWRGSVANFSFWLNLG